MSSIHLSVAGRAGVGRSDRSSAARAVVAGVRQRPLRLLSASPPGAGVTADRSQPAAADLRRVSETGDLSPLSGVPPDRAGSTPRRSRRSSPVPPSHQPASLTRSGPPPHPHRRALHPSPDPRRPARAARCRWSFADEAQRGLTDGRRTRSTLLRFGSESCLV